MSSISAFCSNRSARPWKIRTAGIWWGSQMWTAGSSQLNLITTARESQSPVGQEPWMLSQSSAVKLPWAACLLLILREMVTGANILIFLLRTTHSTSCLPQCQRMRCVLKAYSLNFLNLTCSWRSLGALSTPEHCLTTLCWFFPCPCLLSYESITQPLWGCFSRIPTARLDYLLIKLQKALTCRCDSRLPAEASSITIKESFMLKATVGNKQQQSLIWLEAVSAYRVCPRLYSH